jgi:hypothetical protein
MYKGTHTTAIYFVLVFEINMHCRFYETYILCCGSVSCIISNFLCNKDRVVLHETVGIAVFLEFLHRLHNFPQKWICFRHQVKGRHVLRWVRCKKVTAIIGPNRPKRVGVSHPFIWGRKHIQLPKRCTRYNTGRWAKSKNPLNCECIKVSPERHRIDSWHRLTIAEIFRTKKVQLVACTVIPCSILRDYNLILYLSILLHWVVTLVYYFRL